MDDYDLAVLTLTLQADAHPPAVSCELAVSAEHRLLSLAAWTVGTEDLGLPAYLDPERSKGAGYSFHLPGTFLHQLGDVVQGQLDPRRPLWLWLRKPPGHLGLVPWEQQLIPALGIPVLRLPDFPADPIRSRNTLDVLLCADDQHAPPQRVAEQTVQVINRIVEHDWPPTTVHVFTTSPVHALVASYRGGPRHKVLLYDPVGAQVDSNGEGAAAPSSLDAIAPVFWLQWMRNELCGRSMDLIHFLAPGNLSLSQGGITLAASPSEPGTGLEVVSVAAITRFAMQVGAWCCAFSSPLGNRSEMGLRLAADRVGQLRPGSVLHHELRLDQGGRALADAYRFLVAANPSEPPAHPATFLYCQPFQVVTEPPRHERRFAPVVEAIQPTPEVRDLLAGSATPTWVSAAQRYVEQYEWRIHRWTHDPNGVDPPPELRAGVEGALRLIQDLVHRYANTPSQPPAGLQRSPVTELGGIPDKQEQKAAFSAELPEAPAEIEPSSSRPDVESGRTFRDRPLENRAEINPFPSLPDVDLGPKLRDRPLQGGAEIDPPSRLREGER